MFQRVSVIKRVNRHNLATLHGNLCVSGRDHDAKPDDIVKLNLRFYPGTYKGILQTIGNTCRMEFLWLRFVNYVDVGGKATGSP